MNTKLSIFVLGALLFAASAFSHHPVDRSKTVELTGTVTKVEWQDPHTLVHMDAKDSGGKVAKWTVEMSSAAELTKKGLTNSFLKTGDEVTIEGWQAKDKSNFANAKSVTIMLDSKPSSEHLESSVRR